MSRGPGDILRAEGHPEGRWDVQPNTPFLLALYVSNTATFFQCLFPNQIQFGLEKKLSLLTFVKVNHPLL